MFGNLGCHLIQFPSKRWGFVGTLPVTLADAGPATMADTLGGRSYRGPSGELLAWKFPAFETEAEARAHAAACGVELAA